MTNSLAGSAQKFFPGVPSGSARDGVIAFDTTTSPYTAYVMLQGTWQAFGGTGSAPTAANPTAVAGPAAVNGVAATYMRSDAAPAIQKCSSSVFGLCQVDNSTIVATAGVISVPATGGVIAPAAVSIPQNKIIKGNGSNQGNAVFDLADIVLVLDGGGSPLASGARFNMFVDLPCVISQVTMLADQSGSVALDIQTCSYANYAPGTHPVSGDSITGGSPPSISSASKYQDASLTGWTTTFSGGTVFSLTATGAATNITRVTCSLKIEKT